MIDKRSAPQIKSARDVRDGRDKKRLFCEGEKVVEELLASPLRVREIFSTPSKLDTAQRLKAASAPNAQVHLISESVMDFLSDTETAPGLVALADRPSSLTERSFLDRASLFLVLHHVQLPQNAGALIRSAEAAGVDGICFTSASVDAFSPKVIRGSSGSVFRMKIHTGLSLEAWSAHFRDAGVQTVGAMQHASVVYDALDWTTPTALVLGSEGHGFSKEEAALIEKHVTIPMLGRVESLNVATAGALCLFEAARQRRATTNVI